MSANDLTSPARFFACDQANGNRVVLYDLSGATDLCPDGGEVWDFSPALPARKNMSGVKYRENTVFGDVVVMVASGGYAGIVRYPSKEVIWQTGEGGNNLHSIEILPSGNTVTADSDGNSLRLWTTAALRDGDPAQTVEFTPYDFCDAHGVLWDPSRQVLWAVGTEVLKAYAVTGTGADETLTEIPGMGGALPQPRPYGHDLSADLTDPRYLWVTTDGGVHHFDKEANCFRTGEGVPADLPFTYVKGFGNDRTGRIYSCRSTTGKGTPWENMPFSGWCTDTVMISEPTADGGLKTDFWRSRVCAYYKIFACSGTYL